MAGTAPPSQAPTRPGRRLVHWLCWGLLSVALLIGSFWASPRPGVWLISLIFDAGAAWVSHALAKHVPPGIESQLDVPFSSRWPELRLDVHRPAQPAVHPRPAIIWIHGGAWISGDKSDVANYLRILAAQGWVTIGINYTLAPTAQHPTQVRQVSEALHHVTEQAPRWGIDPHKLILAGDSAGAQLAAQMAAAIAREDYASALGMPRPIDRAALKGVVLFCGPYDLGRMGDKGGPSSPFLRTVAWAFTGSRTLKGHPAEDLASVLRHVDAHFPPAFVSVGNDDTLGPQSVAMADRLSALGVPVDRLFFRPDHQPPQPHEYQFNLDSAEGRAAFERMAAFIRRQVGD